MVRANSGGARIVACYCVTEPETWFLGRVMVSSWKARSATRGFRGEKLIKGTTYITTQKFKNASAAHMSLKSWKLEGEDGQVIVPAENIICTGVEVIHKGMPRKVAEASMGEDWIILDPPKIHEILTSQYLYLGLPQREIIWSKSPQ
jgi:hypothetical protein